MYRTLTDAELLQLEAQGCTAADWSRVAVDEGFDAGRVWRVGFSGVVRIGSLRGEFAFPGGLTKPAGMADATLHNVDVGDNCRIEHTDIANYRIGHDSLLTHVGRILTDGTSHFGNGVRVAVLSEAGGLEVTLTDQLSAQMAALVVARHTDTALMAALERMANRYARRHSSTVGDIGHHVRVSHTTELHNVRIGDFCTVDGAATLSNGTVLSNGTAPTQIGHGVRARDFIVGSGSLVGGGASLNQCFVGQACHVDNGFTASQSLFFNNCQMECGEACAVLAGPFTVSHHKSTLLIGALLSFANAGSGTNQSNHLYKSGPIHYGLMDRGCKTGSGSHIVWPAKIGAFTMVTGRIDSHPDTTELPFSYLMGSSEGTQIVPAANIATLGTLRDAMKWPRRDRRSDTVRHDCTDNRVLSPYTVGRVLDGIALLNRLQAEADPTHDHIAHAGTHIRRATLGKAVRQYRMAVDYYLGSVLIGRLSPLADDPSLSPDDLLRTDGPTGAGEWVDLAGLLAPLEAVDQLCAAIVEGRTASLPDVERSFADMQRHYADHEWAWACEAITRLYGSVAIQPVVAAYRSAAKQLLHLIATDAKKELWMTYFHCPANERAARVQQAPTHPDVSRLSDAIGRTLAKADAILQRVSTPDNTPNPIHSTL